MSNREEILEKIRKLHAHAESAAEIGSEAEAQTFAAKIQELLTAYKLSMDDVHRPAAEKEPINATTVYWQTLNLKVRRVRIAWAEDLARMICQSYYCEFVISLGMGSIGLFIGTETDRKIAVFMYVTIARFLEKLAEREDRKFKYQSWVNAGKPATGRTGYEAHGFKAGFMFGFIQRLRERLDEEIRPKTPQANTAAIVLVRKDALERAQSWSKENLNLKKVASLQQDDGSRIGKQAGRKAADDVSLRPGAFEKTGREKGALR